MNGIKYRFTALLCALIMLFSGSAELLGFAVASRARSVELVASDGKSYRITVTCESGSGIPDDAELYVKEITDVTDAADDIPFAVYSAGSALTYEDYLDRSANLLGGSVNDFAFIKVFDIKLLDPVSGDEYQPLGTVNVSIELLDSDINENTSVNVIHFGAEEELVESAFEGETVEFAAGGFSVYTVAGVDGLPRLTYRFYVPNDGGTYSDYALYTDNGSTFTQRVKRGERPVVPQLTSDSANKSFAGWYEGDNSTGSLTFSASPYDFSEADNITASRAVDLYALFADYAYAVFYDQYDTAAETFPIACLRRVPLSSDPGAPNEVRLDDITVTYNGGESANMALYGWSLTPVTVPGAAKDDYGDDVSVILDATYPVAATVSFYPVFKQIFWLSFYSGTEHSGANYVPPAYYFTAEGPGALPVPTRAGYTFGGWYTGTLSTESDGSGGTVEVVNYGKRMTDENGTPLANQSDGGLYVYGGRLLQTSDATLYAYWNENTAADYRIIIYTQKPDDAEGLADGNKHYDYAESVKLTGDIGQSVTVDNEYKTRSYEGFAYSRCDSAKTVSADGGTVLKVYYDKTAGFAVSGELRSLVFLDSVSSAPSPDLAGTPVALACGESIDSRLPANPVSGRIGYEFRGWFMDTDCTVPAEFGKMPDRDVTYYAGWVSVKYRVEIDPNYGALNGTGALWFNNRVDEDPIREYIQVTREYVESSSGTYYYVKHDFRYYNGNPPSGADRNAYYTTDPGEATEFSTFEYAPNYYRYAGWYEVHDDGSETKYDFSQHTDHNTRLKLHWKRIGTYYIVYNPSATVGGVEVAGVIDGGDGNETLLAALDSAGYADNAEIVVYRSARTETAQPYNFIGWKIRGDESGAVYGAGQAFELNSEFATTIGGKETIYLDAVFARVGTAKIIYDANGGSVDPAAADCGRYYSESGAAFSTAANAVSATAYNIANNADFVLSDGSGFSHGGADITLAGWSDTAEYIPGVSKFFAPGERIVVDSEEPYTLYAIWQTTVTYHLNNAGASWADGEWDGYTDDASGNKCLTVYLGSPVPEPEHVPAYAGTDCMFYSWRTAAYAPGAAPGDENLYDFAQPVTGALDLYAYWDGPVDVPLHAVDSSLAALAGRDAEWLAAEYFPVGTAGVDLGSAAGVAAYMKNGSAAGEIPEGYEFAFVAAHDKNAGIQSISADEAVKRVYYNASRQRLFVEYALDGKADALLSEDTELYIVCFGLEELDIGYRTMGFDGALSDAAVNASAPAKVPAAAQSDITSLVSAPMTYPSAAAQCYSYAIGPAGADNASDLQFITDSGDSDS
ncbi:MAG: InlB B-repeat-containing protein, partial [Clostridia bacterium]|nr:InlB B-repeat-containing protein [Clostridia bacterium]